MLFFFSLVLMMLSQHSNSYSTKTLIWTELISNEGRFSVLLPRKPKKSFNKDQYVQMYTFESVGGANKFAVSYFDAPMPMNDPAIKEQVFELGKKHHAKGRLIESKNILLGEYPGKEYRYVLNLPRGAQYVVKVYLVGQRVYQLDFYTPDKKADFQDANKFFESFKLITET